MKLSEMKSVLAEHDLKLTKSLGQNFLHDQNQLRRIVSAAEVRPIDKILEIGPGLGPLTDMLVAARGGSARHRKRPAALRLLVTKIFPHPNAQAAARRCFGLRQRSTGRGETGNWSPTCPTRSPRRYWWNWPAPMNP